MLPGAERLAGPIRMHLIRRPLSGGAPIVWLAVNLVITTTSTKTRGEQPGIQRVPGGGGDR